MEIAVHSSKAVKPDYASCGVAPGCTTDVVPLTVLDKANFDTYISVIYAFRPPAPPNAVLEAGLARALIDYREWAGRLGVDANDNRAILLNDAGARFVEATADVALDTVMPLKPTPEVLCLHPSGDDRPEELMLIQVTRFACGSLVVGFTTQHIVSDGRATGNFFVAWSQATRGAGIDPVPVHDRASFFVPRDPPLVEHDNRGIEFKPYVKDHHGGNVACGLVGWQRRGGGGGQGALKQGVHLQARGAGVGGCAPAVQHAAVRGGAPVAVHDEGARARRDFGGGRPFFFMPSYLPVEGLLILLPSFLGDGSVDAYVPLFSRDMDTFKNSCYNLE
ncbi:unnamed protein product [Alopecurus aequalis]